MTFARPALAAATALLAVGATACGPGETPGKAPQAREITRPSHETFGEYVVHFSAQPTTMLSPDVARAAGIRRSGTRAMVNIAVLRRVDDAPDLPVSAAVEVSASNLLGQRREVRMRELRDGEAIYYLGELSVANEEIVNFTVRVRPEGAGEAHEFRFQQQFYTD
jgi:hypothetical protein